jgi:microcystin degradation protein MlrC
VWGKAILQKLTVVQLFMDFPNYRKIKDMRRLTNGVRSEICVVRRFRRCTNVTQCTYTNLDSIAYYKPSPYIAYSSQATNLNSMLLY